MSTRRRIKNSKKREQADSTRCKACGRHCGLPVERTRFGWMHTVPMYMQNRHG